MGWELNFRLFLSPTKSHPSQLLGLLPPMPSGLSGKPQHLSKGMAGSPVQLLGRLEDSCFAAKGEGREALQLAEKYAYKRQTCQAAEKALLAAYAPPPAACPRHSAAAHPGGRRLPSLLPSPCSLAPLCLQGRPPGPCL